MQSHKLHLFFLILLFPVVCFTQPSERSLRISLYQLSGEKVNLLDKNLLEKDSFGIKCFIKYHNTGSRSSNENKNPLYEKHDVILKSPCTKKDSNSYESMCYSFSVSLLNIENIKLVITCFQNSMVLHINDVPSFLSKDIVIDPLVFNPGTYTIAYSDIQNTSFERISVGDTLRRRNICNTCFIVNGSPNHMYIWRNEPFIVDDTKLLVIVEPRTIKNIHKFEKLLDEHNMFISENPASNIYKKSLNKYLIVKRKDSATFSRNVCEQLKLLRNDTRYVKFAGQLMHYGKENGIGLAYTNHIKVQIKKVDLTAFEAIVALKKLTIVKKQETPVDDLVVIQLEAAKSIGASVEAVLGELEQSGLIVNGEIKLISSSVEMDLGPQ